MNNPFKAITISLIPNYKVSDVIYSKLLALQPWKFSNKNSQIELETSLSKYLNQKYIKTFDSGRTALYFLLKAIDTKAGDEIIVQALTCSVVSASILWTEANPIYVDIDKTLNIDPEKLISSITPKTKAVIIQHTFGTPANLDKIVSICKSKKIILIEDCAHGLGNSYKNQKLGTFGQASFYSFGRDKVISGIWGGAISTNDESIYQKISDLTKKLPEHSFLWTLKTLMYSPLMFWITKTYGLLKIGKIIHFISRKVKILSDAITPGEKQAIKPAIFYKNLPSPICLLVSRQLQQIDSIIQHRQQLAYFYSQQLNTPYNPDSSYLRYSIEVKDPNKLRKLAATKNIFLGDWYNTVIAPKDIDLELFKYKIGSCPKAEAVTKTIINLPTNPNLSTIDAQKVVNIIKPWK